MRKDACACTVDGGLVVANLILKKKVLLLWSSNSDSFGCKQKAVRLNRLFKDRSRMSIYRI